MDVHRATITEHPIIGIREVVDDPGPLFASASVRLFALAAVTDVTITGAIIGLYYRVDERGFDMAVAVPVAEIPEHLPDGIISGTISPGPAYTAIHRGSYDALPAAWDEMMATIGSVDTTMPCWEEYLVGPETTDDPASWETRLVQPVH